MSVIYPPSEGPEQLLVWWGSGDWLLGAEKNRRPCNDY